MIRLGLNPYGLTYTLGLQGAGTPRANPHGLGLDGFLAIAREYDASCIEIDSRWLTRLDHGALTDLAGLLRRHGMTPVYSQGLTHEPGETLDEAIRCASALGGALIRLHLTPVLEGARGAWGDRWPAMVAHAREVLRRAAPVAAHAGLAIGIEDHQDFGSDELIDLAAQAGDNVGIVLDTGNPFAVGEDPVAFAARVAARVVHVHLKDYVAQFTDDGYRLVRCAIGDGAVPLQQMLSTVAAEARGSLTASVEPAALEARHIRLFTDDWWRGYRPRGADELGRALGRLRVKRIADDADYRTPWETGAPGDVIVAYERDHVRRSMQHVREWLR